MINWADLQQALSPTRSWADLSDKWRVSFSYAFVRQCYNFSIPEISEYTNHLLGGDTRGRYQDYLNFLTRIFSQLRAAGVRDVLDLVEQVDSQEKLEGFITETRLDPVDVVGVLKYLVYWVIPVKKPLGSLVKNDPRLTAAINQLRQANIRTNLDLLDAGITAEARRALAETTGADPAAVDELVNRADFSRLPWASTATISNIIGAGYRSVDHFAGTDLERVSEDFYRYGESIGKNLKYGNEIDNSHRIARLVPKILKD